MGCSFPREFPFRFARNELLDCKAASLAPPELLVTSSGGAVLHRVPDRILHGRGIPETVYPPPAPGGDPIVGNRRLPGPLGHPDVGESDNGLLLAPDSGLGARTGSSRR